MNKKIYYSRLHKLQGFMQEKDVDICLITDRENLIYFAGIEQIECMTIVIPKEGNPVGVTELELAAEAEYTSMKAGSQRTPFRASNRNRHKNTVNTSFFC